MEYPRFAYVRYISEEFLAGGIGHMLNLIVTRRVLLHRVTVPSNVHYIPVVWACFPGGEDCTSDPKHITSLDIILCSNLISWGDAMVDDRMCYSHYQKGVWNPRFLKRRTRMDHEVISKAVYTERALVSIDTRWVRSQFRKVLSNQLLCVLFSWRSLLWDFSPIQSSASSLHKVYFTKRPKRGHWKVKPIPPRKWLVMLNWTMPVPM